MSLTINQLTCSFCTDFVNTREYSPVSPVRFESQRILPYWLAWLPFSEQCCTRKVQQVSCQHLFCHGCYVNFLKVNKDKQVHCPNCQREVENTFIVIDKIKTIDVFETILREFKNNPSQDLFEGALNQIDILRDDVDKAGALNALVKVCVELQNCNFIAAFGSRISLVQRYQAFSDIGVSLAVLGRIDEAMSVVDRISIQKEEGMISQSQSFRDRIKAKVVQYLYDHNDNNNKSLIRASEIFSSISVPDLCFAFWGKYDSFKSDVIRIRSEQEYRKKCYSLSYKGAIVLVITAAAFISFFYLKAVFKNRD